MDTLKLNENHLHESDPRWFAVYTKYKREKLVQKRLEEQGITAYLPVQRLVRRYERKTKTVELPLISCYVFAHIIKKQYAWVLNTADVLHFVKFSQNLIAIPDREIQLLQRIALDGVEMEVEATSFRAGEEVEIVSGNLAGVKGIFLHKERKKNFVIELGNIGYSLRMWVEPTLIKRAKPASAPPFYAGARG